MKKKNRLRTGRTNQVEMEQLLPEQGDRQTFQDLQIVKRAVASKTGQLVCPGNTKPVFYAREDVCQSNTEIVTPYWASNSNGEVRAILNNKEFEQAIHQEICRYVM